MIITLRRPGSPDLRVFRDSPVEAQGAPVMTSSYVDPLCGVEVTTTATEVERYEAVRQSRKLPRRFRLYAMDETIAWLTNYTADLIKRKDDNVL